jgi:hypothetical protein
VTWNRYTGPKPVPTPEQRRAERQLWHAKRAQEKALLRVFRLDNRRRAPK